MACKLESSSLRNGAFFSLQVKWLGSISYHHFSFKISKNLQKPVSILNYSYFLIVGQHVAYVMRTTYEICLHFC